MKGKLALLVGLMGLGEIHSSGSEYVSSAVGSVTGTGALVGMSAGVSLAENNELAGAALGAVLGASSVLGVGFVLWSVENRAEHQVLLSMDSVQAQKVPGP